MPAKTTVVAHYNPAIARIELIATVTCCSRTMPDLAATADVPAASGGRELGKLVCDMCGSEYMLGIIARTLEESRASEVFEHLSSEQEEAAGIDRDDYEPSAEDAAMCARCDGDVNRQEDYCSGCREYVCQTDRVRRPASPRRHAVEEHWEAPKAAMTAAAEIEDDGGTFDADDFVAEA